MQGFMEGITPQLLALQLVTGIALGAVYALLAIGLSLIFGMLTVVNFAHGAFFMVGAFLGVYFLQLTGNFWFSLALVPLVVGTLGLGVERWLVVPSPNWPAAFTPQPHSVPSLRRASA